MILISKDFLSIEVAPSLSSICTVAVPDVTPELVFKVIVPTVLLPPVLL